MAAQKCEKSTFNNVIEARYYVAIAELTNLWANHVVTIEKTECFSLGGLLQLLDRCFVFSIAITRFAQSVCWFTKSTFVLWFQYHRILVHTCTHDAVVLMTGRLGVEHHHCGWLLWNKTLNDALVVEITGVIVTVAWFLEFNGTTNSIRAEGRPLGRSQTQGALGIW